ncbi:MAG: cytochrome c biogenesis protein CcsA [Saprospiraceae bacterium]
MIKRIFDKITSTSASGLYIALFAISIGAATFIENDFGTSAAQKLIFKSFWFELLLVLFGLSILANIFRFRMIQQKKWAILTFHVAILIILIGAGYTRYFGSEGHMHIREGSTSNEIISSEPYITLRFKTANGKSYKVEEPVLFASLGKNKFNKSYQLGSKVIQADLLNFIPNPAQSLVDSKDGPAIIKIVISGNEGREEYFLRQGDATPLHGTIFNFSNEFIPNAVNILYRHDSLLFASSVAFTQFQMTINKTDKIEPGGYKTLLVRALYSNDDLKFVIGDFKPHASMNVTSSSPKMKSESIASLLFNVSVNGKESRLQTTGRVGDLPDFQSVVLDDTEVGVSYGSKIVKLPFYVKLYDFILDRYPGTNSPSSFASEVSLIDDRSKLKMDYRIFMNHILDHDGYRFFQSSFDQDELGTVLSVNHDAIGTQISYLGYFLLTLGMILTLLSKNSRFANIAERLKSKPSAPKAKLTMSVLFIVAGTSLFGAGGNVHLKPINKEHAARFSHVLVQDQNGRVKPMNTLSSELLRKLSRSISYDGLNADQVILGMMSSPEIWADVPLIKMANHEELKKLLHTSGRMVSYNNFFSPDYVLRDAVMKAYNHEPRDRSVLDKELIKLDEKVNICNLIFTGRLMQWFPIENDPNNKWVSPSNPEHQNGVAESGKYLEDYYGPYISAVIDAQESGQWNEANIKLNSIIQYQEKNGRAVLLSPSKVNMEILLNKMDVFNKLGKYYGLIGLIILALFFISVFNPDRSSVWFQRISFGAMAICFFFHVVGLGLRWYVSGRAPWSNGFESMIYIAFTTVLSGLLFSRKSLGGLAATAILASTILMVANLSWMDPEITPLVPVLKSYWLTIHVSMEAGSYGFLTLGALIGVLNLVLMAFSNQNNKEHIYRTINELTLTSEITLIAGLFIISIGTYLGGVWANESWGRYWGWDAKETWALVTILVYAFILHMRFIPGLRGIYAFNVASLFGMSSVMMTYFGVNYYLSGLHSYAAGDPVPIPTFVYYTVSFLILISLLAFWKYRKIYKAA